jgi:hypothetical protein
MKTKLQIAAIFLLILSSFISGCGSGQLFGPTPTPTFTPTLTSTPTPTSTSTPTVTPTPTAGRIQGKVYWMEAGVSAPIENALVELVNAALKPEDSKYNVAETLTDENGRYIFGNLDPGEYGLNVALIPDKYDVKIASGHLECSLPGGLALAWSKDDELLTFYGGKTKDGYNKFGVFGFHVNMATIEVIEKDLDMSCG